MFFPNSFCFALGILSLPHVTQAAGMKMDFLNVRTGFLYQENWAVLESPFTSLCSEGRATTSSRCFLPMLHLASGCRVVEKGPPQVSGSCLSC